MKQSLRVFVSFLSVIAPVLSQDFQACASGMIFNECGTACPLTCENYQDAPLPCTRQCMVGCFCPQGMVQHNGGCIQPSDCPGLSSNPPTQCLNGMVYMSCGTACPLTCDNHETPPLFCTYQCVSGCFCPAGLLQHNGSCVTPSECPSVSVSSTIPETLPTCNNDMEFNHCGTTCPLTCDNYHEAPLPCTRECVAGCFCPWWMVQHGEGCIVHTNCEGISTTIQPSNTQSTVLPCPNGMIFADRCGSECEIATTCDNYQSNTFCDFRCETNCYCPDGMVEHNGQCVEPSMCPAATESTPIATRATTQTSCTNGMIFADRCGSECEIATTCDNYQNRTFCNFRCETNCYCPDGMVEHNGQCVEPSMCPAATESTPIATQATTQPSCTNGMIFADRCGSECEIATTCDNYQSNTFCDFHCETNCYCPDGMVEHNGQCVEPSMCPAATESTPIATRATTQPSCTNGMIFADRCGSECEIATTCDNYQSKTFCNFHCETNCYCPDGMVEHNGQCVEPSMCPAATESIPTIATTQPSCTNGMIFADRCGSECEIATTCDNYRSNTFCDFRCETNCYCPDGMVEHNGQCVEPSMCPAATESTPIATRATTQPSCTNGMIFADRCGSECEIATTCDNYQSNTFCNFHCETNCYCPDGMVEHNGQCVDPLTCPEARKWCIYGKEYRECGPICPETCDTVNGISPCFSLRCGSPGCYCPSGTVLHEGRCINPLKCPTPPPISTVPSIPSVGINKILITMNSREQELEDFHQQQQLFLDAIERILNARGFPGVRATLHTAYVDGHLKIVIQLSGDITEIDANQLAALLNTHLHLLPFPIDQVSVTELPKNTGSISHSEIVTISAISLFAVLVLLLSTVTMVVCLVSRKRQTIIPRDEVYAYTALNDEYVQQQSKLVKESLW